MALLYMHVLQTGALQLDELLHNFHQYQSNFLGLMLPDALALACFAQQLCLIQGRIYVDEPLYYSYILETSH